MNYSREEIQAIARGLEEFTNSRIEYKSKLNSYSGKNPIKWTKKEHNGNTYCSGGWFIHVPSGDLYSDIDTPISPVKFDGLFFYTEHTETMPVDEVALPRKRDTFWDRLWKRK